VYVEPEPSPAVSIPSDDDTDSTESDGECDSEHDSDVDMCMEDDVDAPDGVDLDGDVDMERDGDDEEEEDEEEEDEEKEGVEEEEEEDEDEDDAKEPQTIGQGEMVNTSAEHVDTMVDDQQIVLPEQGQEMHEHTPWPKTPAAAPQPRTPETHPLSGLEYLRLVTPPNLGWRCHLCGMLRQPETPRMWMWNSSCWLNRQVATVSRMSLPLMSLSPMSLSMRCTRMAR